MIEEILSEAEEAVAEDAAPEACECEKEEKEENEVKEDKKSDKKYKRECAELKKENEALTSALAEEKDRYLRMLAEYENFRKRAAKEREGVYADAAADVVGAILPVIDNLERAVAFAPESETESKFASGLEMTLRQFHESLEKLGITEIEADDFDPAVHNAVMHIEDESYGENKVVEVFQKGYRKGDKIIRFAMVKVAN